MWAVFGVRAQFFPQISDAPAHMLSVTCSQHAVQHAEYQGKRDVHAPVLLGHDTPDPHERVDLYSVGVSDA